jgi:hypothetical protein
MIKNQKVQAKNFDRKSREFVLSKVAVTVASALAVLGFSSQLPAAKADTWRGTAPFCDGNCRPGEQELQRSKTGDGARCVTGTKVLCRNSDPSCLVRQTNTECKGVALICDNGVYTLINGQITWNSCSRHLCGACVGWWSDWKEPVKDTAKGLGSILPRSIPSLPRSGNTILPNLPFGPDTCKSGFVWREAIENDRVCVTPNSRAQAKNDNALRFSRISSTDRSFGPNTCIPGFVWREVIPSDQVCVSPQVRQQTRSENSQVENTRVRGSGW